MSERKPIPEPHLRRFADLSCELSPENLSCDGELPDAEVNRKYKSLQKKWRELEAKLGRKVSDEEVWDHLQNTEIGQKILKENHL